MYRLRRAQHSFVGTGRTRRAVWEVLPGRGGAERCKSRRPTPHAMPVGWGLMHGPGASRVTLHWCQVHSTAAAGAASGRA